MKLVRDDSHHTSNQLVCCQFACSLHLACIRAHCPLHCHPKQLSSHSSLADAAADQKGKFEELVESKGVRVLIEPNALMHVIGTTMDFVCDDLR